MKCMHYKSSKFFLLGIPLNWGWCIQDTLGLEPCLLNDILIGIVDQTHTQVKAHHTVNYLQKSIIYMHNELQSSNCYSGVTVLYF